MLDFRIKTFLTVCRTLNYTRAAEELALTQPAVTQQIASLERDYGVKLFKYRTAGVREYWIVNPVKKTVTVYDFENEEKTNQYDFDETIASCIYDDLKINIAGLL